MRWITKASLLLPFLAAAGCGGNDNKLGNVDYLVGGRQTVNGYTAQTYAVRTSGTITEVGVSVPFQLIQNPPDSGDGPAGSFLDIPFPSAAQSTTYFNHFEMHWESQGHPPPVFEVPHFDLHFFTIPQSDVLNISGNDTQVPDANRIPSPYVYPGVDQTVPQMGVHAANPDDLNNDFTKVMILGYWHNQMIFLEPMVTRAQLLTKDNFTMNVPQPEVLGQSTLYPSRFRAIYDAQANAYNFVWDNFTSIAG